MNKLHGQTFFVANEPSGKKERSGNTCDSEPFRNVCELCFQILSESRTVPFIEDLHVFPNVPLTEDF